MPIPSLDRRAEESRIVSGAASISPDLSAYQLGVHTPIPEDPAGLGKRPCQKLIGCPTFPFYHMGDNFSIRKFPNFFHCFSSNMPLASGEDSCYYLGTTKERNRQAKSSFRNQEDYNMRSPDIEQN